MSEAPDVEKLGNFCLRQANVNPNWVVDGRAFWYRRESEPDKFEFVLVNCTTGTRQAAFDHAKLAHALAAQTGKDIDPHRLPFWWINPAEDGAWVRFQYEAQTWQFGGADGRLERWDGAFDTGNFVLDAEERPSPEGDGVASPITFVNYTAGLISFHWIDHKGEATRYGAVPAGERTTQLSYAGHVWRIALEADSEKKTVCAVQKTPTVVTVTESPLGLHAKVEDETSEEALQRVEGGGSPSAPGGADGEARVFVRDYNVWLKDDAGGGETQISTNGSEDDYYRQTRIYPSADGKMAVVWQQSREPESQLHLIEAAPKDGVKPKLSSRQYLRPGDERRKERLRLFNLEQKGEVVTSNELFENPFEMSDLGWSSNGDEYRFLFNERGHKILRVLAVSRDGAVRTIVEEKSQTFIDYSHKTYHRIIEDTQELLWTSERDGWNHLYLIDLQTGAVKNQVTKGEWPLRSVDYIDEKGRRIWFRALGIVPGQDPYYSHLARVNFDGSDLCVITEGNGTHGWKWSPDRKYLVDSWSRADEPPQVVLRDAESGKQIVELESSQLGMLRTAGWSAPERFDAPGRDGATSIYGLIWRPEPFDPSKKYPVLEFIYAGPQAFYTPKNFQPLPKLRKRVDQGYVIVMLDGMGTNWRSKAFHDVCYKNLKDAGFPDRMAWMRSAAATRPWMDLDRVGCFGSSAGGQNAAAAVIHHGDFYKAACAAAGCHDNRVDKQWWNEAWMGYPVDESYEASSNAAHAAKLTGKLQLSVGLLDTNVDPCCTLQLADALIKEDKDFDLVVIPSGDHHVAKLDWVVKKQDAFFARHLRDI